LERERQARETERGIRTHIKKRKIGREGGRVSLERAGQTREGEASTVPLQDKQEREIRETEFPRSENTRQEREKHQQYGQARKRDKYYTTKILIGNQRKQDVL
jgi:hypothetical protein